MTSTRPTTNVPRCKRIMQSSCKCRREHFATRCRRQMHSDATETNGGVGANAWLSVHLQFGKLFHHNVVDCFAAQLWHDAQHRLDRQFTQLRIRIAKSCNVQKSKMNWLQSDANSLTRSNERKQFAINQRRRQLVDIIRQVLQQCNAQCAIVARVIFDNDWRNLCIVLVVW